MVEVIIKVTSHAWLASNSPQVASGLSVSGQPQESVLRIWLELVSNKLPAFFKSKGSGSGASSSRGLGSGAGSVALKGGPAVADSGHVGASPFSFPWDLPLPKEHWALENQAPFGHLDRTVQTFL